eukprot:1324005-Pleurochrysis_carterae.AAC.1
MPVQLHASAVIVERGESKYSQFLYYRFSERSERDGCSAFISKLRCHKEYDRRTMAWLGAAATSAC